MARENLQARRTRAVELCERLGRIWPDARVALDWDSPWHLLVAVILSAQTTDAGVNRVTPALFARYPGPAELAAADPEDVKALIRPTGFFNNKTKSITGAARAIVAEHGGEVPCTMEELTSLPGVARKSANIVLAAACGVVEGIAVDTHVIRLVGRLAFSKEKDPVKIERDLMALLPREHWREFNFRFVNLGRHICTAKRPDCGQCPVVDLCPTAFKTPGWRDVDWRPIAAAAGMVPAGWSGIAPGGSRAS